MSTWTVLSYAGGWTVPGFIEQRELGRGPSGRVVEAVDDGSGRRVAIKYLSPALAGDPAFMQRFRAETQALRELLVPQVVQVHDFVEQPGLGAAVITELVNGVSLRELIELGGPVHPEAALTVLKEMLLALAAAHALGIVHRDGKPGNVLADTAGNSKLADFGWAVRDGQRLPPEGMSPYLAPELWQGASESPATDLYAATAILFFCLAGQPPFAGATGQLREQHATAAVPADLVAPPLRRLITRGMAKVPALRPLSAIAFAAELEALAVSAYGAGWEERGRGQLAERVTAILPLASRAVSGGAQRPPLAPAAAAAGGGRRRTVAIAAVAATVVIVIGGVAAAVTLKDKNPGHPASLSGSSSPGASAMSSSSAAAPATRPATSQPATPAASNPAPATRPATSQPATPPTSHTASATPSASPKSSSPGRLYVNTGTVTAQAVRGTAYTGYVTVSGGKGPYAWGAVTGLPAGLKAAANGATLTISGTPTQVGDFNPTLSVKDGSSPPLTSAIGFAISVKAPPLTVTVNAPASATNGKPYSGTITAAGGDGTYTWSQAALPAGLKAAANGATLTISGTPAKSATTTLSGKVSDGESPAHSVAWSLKLTVSWPPITLTAKVPATATVGKAYVGTVTATGGIAGTTVAWTVTGLPPGLKKTASGATLTIKGTPTTAHTPGYSITVKAATGAITKSASYTVLVSSAA